MPRNHSLDPQVPRSKVQEWSRWDLSDAENGLVGPDSHLRVVLINRRMSPGVSQVFVAPSPQCLYVFVQRRCNCKVGGTKRPAPEEWFWLNLRLESSTRTSRGQVMFRDVSSSVRKHTSCQVEECTSRLAIPGRSPEARRPNISSGPGLQAIAAGPVRMYSG